MTIRKGLALGFVVAAAVTSTMTRAGDDTAAKEQKAVKRTSLASAMSDRDGRYHHARGLAVEGPNSVEARTEAWLRNMDTWVQGWAKVLAFADLKDDLTYDVFLTQLQNLLDAQGKALVALQKDADAIQKLGADALRVLGTPQAVDLGTDAPTYSSVTTALGARERAATTMITSVSGLPAARRQALADVDEVSRTGITAHVKAALIARAKYPLQQALADVDALLLAEKVIDPGLARLDATYTQMNSYNSNLAYFHGLDAIDAARQTCTTVRASLATLTGPQPFLSDQKARADRFCNGIETAFTSLTGNAAMPHWQYVKNYIALGKPKLRTVCAVAGTGPACERLALLASLARTDLMAMDDAHLQFVEMGWSEAMDRATSMGGT